MFETISTKPSFYLSCQVDCLFNLKTMAPRKTTVVDQHYLHITQFNFKCVSAFMFSSLLVVSTSLLLSTHWYYTDHHKQNKKTKQKPALINIQFSSTIDSTLHMHFLKNSYFSHQTSNVLWCTCSVQNTPQYPVVTGYLATVQ